jgi:hypothetical protein
VSKDAPIGVVDCQMVIHRSLVDEVGGFRNSTPQTFHNDDLNMMLMSGLADRALSSRNPTLLGTGSTRETASGT